MSSAGIIAGSAASGAAQGSAAGPYGALAGGAIGAIGGVFGAKGAKAAKKAAKAAKRLQSLQRFRARVDAIRSYRLQRAEAEAQAGNANAQNDSAVVGAIGAFQSQTSTNFGYANQEKRLQDTIAKAGADAGRFAGIGQAIGQFAQVAGAFGGGPSSPSGGAPAASGGHDYSSVSFDQPVSFESGTVGGGFSFSNPGAFL